MSDQPVIITGGSLRITVTKNSLRLIGTDADGTTHYEHPATGGKIKGLKIGTKDETVPEDITVEIKFEVP